MTPLKPPWKVKERYDLEPPLNGHQVEKSVDTSVKKSTVKFRARIHRMEDGVCVYDSGMFPVGEQVMENRLARAREELAKIAALKGGGHA